jgi:hypothetical protein
VRDVEKHIADKLLPALRAAIVQELGEPQNDEWSLSVDAADAQTLNFHYPVALPTAEYQGMAYITPRVKLELGARGDPWPAETNVIRPYTAEDFPDFVEDPDMTVTVLSARRTFWEKATALHAEANRPADSVTPQYFSRLPFLYSDKNLQQNRWARWSNAKGRPDGSGCGGLATTESDIRYRALFDTACAFVEIERI